MEQFKNDTSPDKMISIFALMCLHAVTNGHINHWRAKTFSIHSALGEFYTELQENIDAVIEAYMGKYGVLEDYTEFYSLPSKDPIQELEQLSDVVKEIRAKLPQDSELQNLIDEIADLIDSTLYKVRFLK
jgi:DNA-binding ferritin-like protein